VLASSDRSPPTTSSPLGPLLLHKTRRLLPLLAARTWMAGEPRRHGWPASRGGLLPPMAGRRGFPWPPPQSRPRGERARAWRQRPGVGLERRGKVGAALSPGAALRGHTSTSSSPSPPPRLSPPSLLHSPSYSTSGGRPASLPRAAVQARGRRRQRG
jgi:hypothetical protein